MTQFSDLWAVPSTANAVGLTWVKLIRSTTTKAFLTSEGQWTDNVQHAEHFPDFFRAEAAVQKFRLHGVELYFLFNRYSTSQYDFTLPLT